MAINGKYSKIYQNCLLKLTTSHTGERGKTLLHLVVIKVADYDEIGVLHIASGLFETSINSRTLLPEQLLAGRKERHDDMPRSIAIQRRWSISYDGSVANFVGLDKGEESLPTANRSLDMRRAKNPRNRQLRASVHSICHILRVIDI